MERLQPVTMSEVECSVCGEYIPLPEKVWANKDKSTIVCSDCQNNLKKPSLIPGDYR